jgi:signal transduction histidine kinase
MLRADQRRPTVSGPPGEPPVSARLGVDVLGVRRICAAAAVVYRLLSTTASAAYWLSSSHSSRPTVVVVMVAFVAYHLVAIRIILSTNDFAYVSRRRTVALDATAAAICAVLLAEFARGVDPSRFVGWDVVVATVALWTVARGWTTGITLTVLSIPLGYVVGWVVNPSAETATLMFLASTTVHCALALVGVALLQPSVWARMSDWARAVGKAERAVERARTQRVVHDTAVQALDAIRLLATTSPPGAQAETLRRVGEVATRELGALRLALTAHHEVDSRGEGDQADLSDALDDAVHEAGRRGLQVRVVDGRNRHAAPTRDRVLALRGAVGEALTNTARHSGASHATVRVDAVGNGLELVVSDRGRGFDPSDTPDGFGLRESVRARLTEVGGTASVLSRPGRGVDVRLWVPI